MPTLSDFQQLVATVGTNPKAEQINDVATMLGALELDRSNIEGLCRALAKLKFTDAAHLLALNWQRLPENARPIVLRGQWHRSDDRQQLVDASILLASEIWPMSPSAGRDLIDGAISEARRMADPKRSVDLIRQSVSKFWLRPRRRGEEQHWPFQELKPGVVADDWLAGWVDTLVETASRPMPSPPWKVNPRPGLRQWMDAVEQSAAPESPLRSKAAKWREALDGADSGGAQQAANKEPPCDRPSVKSDSPTRTISLAMDSAALQQVASGLKILGNAITLALSTPDSGPIGSNNAAEFERKLRACVDQLAERTAERDQFKRSADGLQDEVSHLRHSLQRLEGELLAAHDATTPMQKELEEKQKCLTALESRLAHARKALEDERQARIRAVPEIEKEGRRVFAAEIGQAISADVANLRQTNKTETPTPEDFRFLVNVVQQLLTRLKTRGISIEE